jgi:lysine 2,3-aminomutase
MSEGRTLRTAAELLAAGLIGPAGAAAAGRVAERYAVAVTPAMARLIERADDPIARQFLPDPDELRTRAGETADPTGDAAHSPIPGIVHRHGDRVLLAPLLACPVYCRFCFRRERVGPGGKVLSRAELDAAINYIAARPAIWEVILTGGDPLMLSPRRLGALLARLDAIPHLAVVRIHSRVPVVDPSRVGGTLAAALAGRDKALWLGLHVNHPRELTPAALAAIRRLAEAGVGLLSQSVLLAGVNDDAATLEALFRALVRARVKPYYLHQLDPAPGTARFAVPIERGREIMAELRARASGLALPTYVVDLPGGRGKVPAEGAHLGRAGEAAWVARAHDGGHLAVAAG